MSYQIGGTEPRPSFIKEGHRYLYQILGQIVLRAIHSLVEIYHNLLNSGYDKLKCIMCSPILMVSLSMEGFIRIRRAKRMFGFFLSWFGLVARKPVIRI